jgi:polysaccharide pyruvyl transferase CsaB
MNIVVAANYGAKNIGDEMILEGIIEFIKSTHVDSKITVLSDTPKETSEKYKVNSEKKFPSGFRTILKSIFSIESKTKKAVKDCDYFVLGGGGLFCGVEKKANIIWGIQALRAILYKKPILIIGQSVGINHGKLCEIIVRFIFNRAESITVRDKDSKKNLKKMGIKKKINVMPDMALRINRKKNIQIREKIMIVALREMDSISDEFKENIAKFINWLTMEREWRVKMINFQEGEHGDGKLHREILKKLYRKNKIELIENVKSSKELYQYFEESKMLLGMRLHSIITAIKTSTPFIAIDYAEKVKGFVNLAGMNEYIIKPAILSSGEIYKKFDKIEENEAKIIKELDNFNKKTEKLFKEAETYLIPKEASNRELNSSKENL